MTKGMKTQSMTRTCIKPVNDNVNWGSSLWLSFMFSPCEGSEGTWRNPVIPHQFKRSCFDVGPSHALLLPMTSWTKKKRSLLVSHAWFKLSVSHVGPGSSWCAAAPDFPGNTLNAHNSKKKATWTESHKVVSSNSVKGQPTMSATNRSTISESA